MIASLYWRKGEFGDGTQYTFYPKPAIQRNLPGQRLAQFEIPGVDGAILQKMGISVRRIQLSGVIFVRPANYDNLTQAKLNLESGIGTLVGQLHIESLTGQSNRHHSYYKGIVEGDIQWAEQSNPQIMEYKINFLCVDPVEYEYYTSSSSSRSSSSSSSSCKSSSSSSSSCRSSSSSCSSCSSSSSCRSSSSSSKSSSSSSYSSSSSCKSSSSSSSSWSWSSSSSISSSSFSSSSSSNSESSSSSSSSLSV